MNSAYGPSGSNYSKSHPACHDGHLLCRDDPAAVAAAEPAAQAVQAAPAAQPEQLASRYHWRFSYLWHCPLSRPGKYYACGLSESNCSRSHMLLLNLLHLLILLHLLHWSSSPNSLHQTPTAPARSQAMLITVNYHPQCRNSNSISEGWTLKAELWRLHWGARRLTGHQGLLIHYAKAAQRP